MQVINHSVCCRLLLTTALSLFIAGPVLAAPNGQNGPTHCDSCGPYTGACQGVETYVSLDGTMSTGAGTLEFSWTSDCPNADLLDPTTATPTLILYDPGLGIPVDCKVYLQINDTGACGCGEACTCIDQCESVVQYSACTLDCQGTPNGSAVVDRCGVCNGDGNSCLGCNSVDILSNQFTLDGNSFALRGLVDDAARSLQKTSRLKSDQKFAKNARKDADKLYIQGWSLVWNLPSVITSCTNQEFCVSTDNSATIQTFNGSSKALNDLLKSVIKRLQKARHKKLKKDNKLLKQGDQIHQQNLDLSGTVPTTASACTPA